MDRRHRQAVAAGVGGCEPAIEAVAARNGLDLSTLPPMRPSVDDAFAIVLP